MNNMTAEQIGQEILNIAATHSASVDELLWMVRLRAVLADVGIQNGDIERVLIKAYPNRMDIIATAWRITQIVDGKNQFPYAPG